MTSNEMSHYTKEELAHIVTGLHKITIKGLPVFRVNIINARTNEYIGLNDIKSSGMVYIKINNWQSVGNFAVWVDVPEPSAND